jgi:hypothetical protein
MITTGIRCFFMAFCSIAVIVSGCASSQSPKSAAISSVSGDIPEWTGACDNCLKSLEFDIKSENTCEFCLETALKLGTERYAWDFIGKIILPDKNP